MNILLMWLSTIILSKGMNYITIGRIFKDIYGNGYKINLKKFLENSNNFSDSRSKIRQYIMFLNIYDSINMGLSYLNNPDSIISFFHMNDSLEEMDNNEKKLYNEKPSLFRGLYISELSEEKLEKKEKEKSKYKDAIQMIFNDKGKTSFSLEYIKRNNKINIDKINIKTDVLFNIDDSNYNSFIMNELKAIKKVIKYPIKKERLIRYLKRLNKKENISIIEEKINVMEENRKLEMNSRLVKYDNLTVSDVAFDESYNYSEYINSVISGKPVSLKLKRSDKND